jgi:hypothetical protein
MTPRPAPDSRRLHQSGGVRVSRTNSRTNSETSSAGGSLRGPSSLPPLCGVDPQTPKHTVAPREDLVAEPGSSVRVKTSLKMAAQPDEPVKEQTSGSL